MGDVCGVRFVLVLALRTDSVTHIPKATATDCRGGDMPSCRHRKNTFLGVDSLIWRVFGRFLKTQDPDPETQVVDHSIKPALGECSPSWECIPPVRTASYQKPDCPNGFFVHKINYMATIRPKRTLSPRSERPRARPYQACLYNDCTRP